MKANSSSEISPRPIAVVLMLTSVRGVQARRRQDSVLERRLHKPLCEDDSRFAISSSVLT